MIYFRLHCPRCQRFKRDKIKLSRKFCTHSELTHTIIRIKSATLPLHLSQPSTDLPFTCPAPLPLCYLFHLDNTPPNLSLLDQRTSTRCGCHLRTQTNLVVHIFRVSESMFRLILPLYPLAATTQLRPIRRALRGG